ncbi:hypothetical protein [Fructilactobacillus sanfranciscensis]|uniref:Uncharacterized protein n=1 Tax=Fructilactobacillus sanfranciscensis TaxID=1625 RepID=A0A5C4TL99_FRUSA|nr:hypothetical protein [Fructilactobacillus sanfranciscensis]TNK90912.1 hypothetical protein DID87_02075 [Fructilactobacillus sanfranciscensis]TNK96024.1 hypothetical protein DKP74_01800 [Fructilactobacillus sanfranciscensis]TNL00046.1 hypothetical protein DK130_02340 [Fructilactobacillus sanfranciscensis]
MEEKSFARIQEIVFQLEQIDEIFWQNENSEKTIPSTLKWTNIIGESDRNGNWIYPAEYLGSNDSEINKIKMQRKLVNELRMIVNDESRKVNDYVTVKKTKEEKEKIINDLLWARKFGLTTKECAQLFGENPNYLSHLLTEIRKIENQ